MLKKLLVLVALGSMPLALAGCGDDLESEKEDVQEAEKELQEAQRKGDPDDIEEARNELQEENQELQEERRDNSTNVDNNDVREVAP